MLMPDRFATDTDANRDKLAAFFKEHGVQAKVAPGEAVAHQGEHSETVFRILRGCVRSTVYSEDGDRKVLQFLGAGDILGLNNGADWPASQEAVDLVVLQAAPRRALEAEILDDPDLERAVRACLARQIEAYTALLLLTAQTTAVERVRGFLARFAARRGAADFVALPMGRQDIADHLGLSMETVSRAFSTLKAHGDIALKGSSFFRLNRSDAFEEGLPHAA